MINNPPLRYIIAIMFYATVTVLLIGPLKQMAHHTLIEFILINICYLSAVWQQVVWRKRKNLFWLRNSWLRKRCYHPHQVTWGIFSPYCTCSLGLHISTEYTITSVERRALQPQLAGTLPLPFVSWQAVSIITVPAVNCKAQVIVRGVDRRAEAASASGTSVELRWTHATPASLADSARFGCYGQCICHNVSTPCSSLLQPLQGWNHSSSYSSLGLEAIHHEARDPRQFSDGRESEERQAFERQIHLDLIGKQVCSRLLSRFPPRWSLRDNGAEERR